MNITIVVPAFNEEKRIKSFLKEVEKLKRSVIVVDDGSSDNTFSEAKKYSTEGKITVIRHKVNLGKGAAMKTGADAAFLTGSEAVVFMDGDGQHSIKDFAKFSEKLENSDVVLGERQTGNKISVRIYGSRIISRIANRLYGVRINDFLCGYRGLTRKAYEKLRWNSTGYGVETEMIARMGKNKIKYSVVPVKTIYHDVYKGFSVIDALNLLYNIVSWRLTL